jgi:hypothetical protein
MYNIQFKEPNITVCHQHYSKELDFFGPKSKKEASMKNKTWWPKSMKMTKENFEKIS